MQRSLRLQRDELLADASLHGDAFCTTYAAAADQWLADLVDRATSGDTKHVALVAVGGYGRGELCPYSDLDLVLIHSGRSDIAAIADRIWYPIWDEGVSLDHSVRRPKEVHAAAAKDLRVALGLLDARIIAGDQKTALPVLAEVQEIWRSRLGGQFLTDLADQMAARHAAQGDLAYLLEPNLKESHGGLRDVNVLTAVAKYAPRLGDLVDLRVLEPSASLLTAVRVELHRGAGRDLDRLLLQEQDACAERLGMSDADALMRAVSEAGRTIARLSDDIWRRRTHWEPLPSGRGRRKHLDTDERSAFPIDADIVEIDGELTLTSAAPVATDPTLAFRLAAHAAELDRPISLVSLYRLADQMGDVPDPWPPALLEAFIRLLATGRRGIVAFEALDQLDLITKFLPEWEPVRYHHQRNAYHRFTTDRHLLEATANAALTVHRVDRGDLLLLGTLLHDIGKGRPGDHTEVGMVLAATIGHRLGLSVEDTATLVAMVEHHLLLPDTATRRDLSDPATIARVAELTKNRQRLLLLHGLTVADSQATGPAAWGPWKANLVDELVRRTLASFDGADSPPIASWVTDAHRRLMETARTSTQPEVVFDPPRIAVAALDRPGLLALVTGTLATFGLEVHSADILGESGVALEVFTVSTDADAWPEASAFAAMLHRVVAGDVDLDRALAERRQVYDRARRPQSARPATPTVATDREASSSSTVIEVRAEDRLGLLHELTSALFNLNVDVVSARVSTTGSAVVDVFYLRTADGRRLDDADRVREICDALAHVLAGPTIASAS